MNIDQAISKFFKKKKKATFQKLNIYANKRSILAWFMITDFEEEYMALKGDQIVVTYEIDQAISNFIDDSAKKKIVLKNTEAFSKIDVPYTFLSLVKSKDMSSYTQFLTDQMEKQSGNTFKENGLFKLREYVNTKVSINDFSERGYYLIFSDDRENIEAFSAKLNYIKTELANAQITLRKLTSQEQIDLVYTYFNPDTTINHYTIHSYSNFFNS